MGLSKRIEGVKCDMIPDETGDLTFASTVFFPKNGDNPWVGSKAARRATYEPKRTVYDSKRMMCKKLTNRKIRRLMKNWPFDLDSTKNDIVYKLGDVERKSPQDIA